MLKTLRNSTGQPWVKPGHDERGESRLFYTLFRHIRIRMSLRA
jgi:hypothetical protein